MLLVKDIVVLGTGSLARAFCCAYASAVKDPCTMRILGRDAIQARNLAAIVNSRSGLAGGKIFADAGPIEWSMEGIHNALCKLEPRVVLMVSSLQSPWEGHNKPSEWTRILSEAGYGISLPLQALLASRLCKVMQSRTSRPLIVNACYPDAVNPLLHSLHLPIDVGIGNISILSAILEFTAPADQGSTPGQEAHKDQASPTGQEAHIEWKLLAHHAHIGSFGGADGLPPPIAWRGAEKIENVTERLSILHTLKGEPLNQITGATAVPLVRALLHKQKKQLHAPGPNGLPGGYPLEVSGSGIKILDVPGMDLRQMTEWNQSAAKADGVQVRADGQVLFQGQAASVLRKLAPSLAKGFRAADLEDFTAEFMQFQNKTRNI